VEFADDLGPAGRESWSTRQADAMVSMASHYLSGQDGQRNSSDDYLVTVHVDQSALANGNGRSSLPLDSVKRLCCDGQVVILGEDEKGEPLNIGRKTRTVSTAISRALRARDKGCRFPGCQHTRFVDAHHIEHWSNGGETSLDNLMLLCSQHHKLIHEGGFTLERDYQNQWFFKRPDGKAVPNCGYNANDMIDDDIGLEGDEFSELLNNPSPEGLLSAVEKLVSEPPPPVYWH
jgi:5-methylcytosine-specific restriction endonuclease McrA